MKPVNIAFSLSSPASEQSAIVARFYFAGKPFKFYPGISVKVSDWRAAKQRLDHRKDLAWEVNEQLNLCESSIRACLLSFQKNGIDSLTQKQMSFAINSEIERAQNLSQPQAGSEFVEDFFKEWIDQKTRNKKSVRYKQQHQQVIDHAVAARPNLRFTDINDQFFSEYVAYLIEEEGNVDSTIKEKVKKLKKICREAAKHGYKVNPHFEDFAYSGYSVPAVYLQWSEVEALEGLQGLTEKERYHRDRFLFRCYTGIRHSEMVFLHAAQINDAHGVRELSVNQVKSSKLSGIHIPAKAMKILEDWEYRINRFPTINRDNKEGIAMKDLAKRAGLSRTVQIVRFQGGKPIREIKLISEVISSHTARRTYARAWYERGGDLFLLKDKLGHTDLSTTLKYIGLEHLESSKEAARLFG